MQLLTDLLDYEGFMYINNEATSESIF